jgi:hypothetical protein
MKIDSSGVVSITNESSDGLIIERTGTTTGKYRFGIGGTNLLTIRDVAQSATRMAINSSGNVGIGTTSPDTQLHIYNSDSNWGAYSVITLGTDVEGTNQAQLKYYRGASTSTESFQLSVRGTTALTALYNGNVGIGATDPVKTLDVRGQLAISNSASSYWYLDRNNSTGNFEILTDTNSSVFNIDTSGNVGIGTATPSSKLNIETTKTVALSTAADFLTLGLTVDDNNAFDTAGLGGGIAFRGKRN